MRIEELSSQSITFPTTSAYLSPGAVLCRLGSSEHTLILGVSAAKDGLALYPLQWVLIESRKKGLELDFDGSFGGRAKIDDPLEIVFPSYESEGKGVDISTFTVKNDIKVDIQDLRRVHGLTRYGTRYAIHLNQSKRLWIRKEPRAAFNDDGTLKGYCEFGLTPKPSDCKEIKLKPM